MEGEVIIGGEGMEEEGEGVDAAAGGEVLEM